MADLTIRNGEVVTPHGIARLSIAIQDGTIVALGRDKCIPSADHQINADGLYVLPGIIDDHVHFREPGLTEKEDMISGSRAAAAGGVTTVLDMPNTIPPVADQAAFKHKKSLIHGRSYVDIGLYAVITEDNLDQLYGIAQLGAIGLKVFMGETTGYIRCPENSILYQAMHASANLGLRVGAHAENDALIQAFKQKLTGFGRTDPRAHLDSRPPCVETEAIARGILLSEQAGSAFHVFHLSTMQGLELIQRARRRKLPVTTEVLVGHLLFSEEDYSRLGNQIRLNPPIRSKAHQQALWHGLRRGWIDAIATDHAPHKREEKSSDNVWTAACGFIGVETALSLMLTQVNKGMLSLETYVRATSENPARIWGLYPMKGAIQVGSDADFVIVDMQATSSIEESTLHNKNPYTPYEGWTVQGIPKYTILRGQIIMAEGEILNPPRGAFLPPSAKRPFQSPGP